MRKSIEKFDHAAMLAMARHRHPAVTTVLRVLTWTGEGRSWAILVVVLALGIHFDFLRFPHREFVFFSTLAPGISWIFVQALKIFWRRRRPFQILTDFPQLTPAPKDESFPSGHTASVFAFAAAMAPLGPLVAGALAIWAGIVAFSRYYLGVHFPSDIFVGAVIGILAGAGLTTVHSAYGADKYPNYTEMAKHEREGVDFFVDMAEPRAKILVLAIHGQYVEPGSDDVAEAIAGSDFRKYIFRANKNVNWGDLHVTSTHFDDPRAIDLAKGSELCVSVHGYKEPTKIAICLGGANIQAKTRVGEAIHRAFPEIIFDTACTEIGGTDPANIANRCLKQGVQLELSKKVRDLLKADPVAMAKFADAVRSAIQTWK